MSAPRSVCPRCHRTYGGPTQVCMVDGSPLVAEDQLPPADPERDEEAPRSRTPSRSMSSPRASGPHYNPQYSPPDRPIDEQRESQRNRIVAPQQTRSGTMPPQQTRSGTLPPTGARILGPARSATPIPFQLDDSSPSPPNVEHLGPYRLMRQLGEGGMARIYLAEHEKLGRICAIKRLHADHFTDRLTVARFLAEARAIGAIHHPNLVSAFDVVEEPSEIYLVMEYLDGRDVAQLLRDDGPIAPDRAAEIIAQACDGLAAVHAHNIIHRDLKPENIFLTRNADGGGERVKLLDFGVARLMGDRPQELKTRSGLTVGTPTYMSPEQATASVIDARSDIYTVGVVLYEMLTGTPPFTGAGYGDVMLMHVNDAPPRLSTRARNVPAWLEAVVMRCLEKEPSDRFQSAVELSAALRQGVSTAPSSDGARAQGGGAGADATVRRQKVFLVVGVATTVAAVAVVASWLLVGAGTGSRPVPPRSATTRAIPAPAIPPAPPLTPVAAPVNEASPAVKQASPSVNEASPSVNEASPSVKQAPPSVKQAPPSVKQAPPSVKQAPPSVKQAPPSVKQAPPSVKQAPPSVNAVGSPALAPSTKHTPQRATKSAAVLKHHPPLRHPVRHIKPAPKHLAAHPKKSPAQAHDKTVDPFQ